ncbi:MAG: hypothetical protein ABJE95_29360 [Byssovorax sp.]
MLIARASQIVVATLAALAIGGCSGEGAGTAQIFVEPEDTITHGLQAGAENENIHDGWSVSYSRFVVVVGAVRAARSDTLERVSSPGVHVLDLLRAPASGYVVADLPALGAARWDRFGFDLSNASTGAVPLAPTTADDAAFMIEHGYSIYFEGKMENPNGMSHPPGGKPREAKAISFRWGFRAGTSFDDCSSSDGIAGFAVPSGGTIPVKPTIHGDHWFFSNFTSGVELTERRAQYLADADANGDGETTIDELKSYEAADAFPIPAYNLSGALGGPIHSAYDYVLAEMRTIGHFQGDGECPTRSVLP